MGGLCHFCSFLEGRGSSLLPGGHLKPELWFSKSKKTVDQYSVLRLRLPHVAWWIYIQWLSLQDLRSNAACPLVSAIPSSNIMGWEMCRSSSFGVCVSSGMGGQCPRHPSPVPHGKRGGNLMWAFPPLIFAPGWWNPLKKAARISPAGPCAEHLCCREPRREGGKTVQAAESLFRFAYSETSLSKM